MRKGLFAHTSAYSIGSLLVTLSGLISFPILTRVLSVSEYGLMSLISATLLALVGVGKLGVQHSIVRFHGEVLGPTPRATRGAFFSTVVIAMAATGFVVALVWAAASQFIPAQWWGDPAARWLLLVTAALIFIRTTDSALMNLLRAQERSIAYNVYSVVKRYAALGLALATIVYFIPGLNGFYAATILVEGLVVLLGFAYFRAGWDIRFANFDRALYASMLAFGIPMIAYEVGGIVMSLADRFVIQHAMGTEAVGLYAAAYNLCEYVQLILLASIGQAVVPMYVRLWEERGEEETRRFVETTMHFYVALGAAVVAGLSAVDQELLALLASEKYLEGASIIPLVIGAMVVNGGGMLYGAGLYIHKQTRRLILLVVGCAVFNIALNFVLVPRLGLTGAALATLASYSILAALTVHVGNRSLRLGFPWKALAKFGILSIVMYWVVAPIDVGSRPLTLALKVLAGAVLYAAMAVAADAVVRNAALSLLRRAARRTA